MTSTANNETQWTARHVILGFVAFFVVLIAVQAVFIGIAVSTHTGVVSKQPYRKGLNYGDRIAFAEKQEERGWTETLELSSNQDRLMFRLVDKEGTPIPFLNVTGELSRPVHKNDDQKLSFNQDGDGNYSIALTPDLSGAFIADIEARKGPSEELVWRTRRRIWIKP